MYVVLKNIIKICTGIDQTCVYTLCVVVLWVCVCVWPSHISALLSKTKFDVQTLQTETETHPSGRLKNHKRTVGSTLCSR